MLFDKCYVEQVYLIDQFVCFWCGWFEMNCGNMLCDEMIWSVEWMILFYLFCVNDNDWLMIDVNFVFVDQICENLCCVVCGMLVCQCVYEEIKVCVLICFVLMIIVCIVGDGNQGFVVGSYVILGMFMCEVWFDYVQLVICDVVIKELQVKDWVFNMLMQDDLMFEGSFEQIQKMFVGMYKIEYVQYWQKFMQGIVVQGFISFGQVVDGMNCFGDLQDLLICKIFEIVYDQMLWDNLLFVNVMIKKVQMGVVNWVKQLFLCLQVGQVVVVNIDINGNLVEVLMGLIGQEFVGFVWIVVMYDGMLMLKGYMELLLKVCMCFNVIKNQGDLGLGVCQLMQQMFDGSGLEFVDLLKFVDEQMLMGLIDL